MQLATHYVFSLTAPSGTWSFLNWTNSNVWYVLEWMNYGLDKIVLQPEGVRSYEVRLLQKRHLWWKPMISQTINNIVLIQYIYSYNNETICWLFLHISFFSPPGLFHRAIAQSGHAMNYRAVVTSGQNLRRAWEFAKLVGCKSAAIISSESLVECMRNVPIRMLTINMYGLMVCSQIVFAVFHLLYKNLILHICFSMITYYPIHFLASILKKSTLKELSSLSTLW